MTRQLMNHHRNQRGNSSVTTLLLLGLLLVCVSIVVFYLIGQKTGAGPQLAAQSAPQPVAETLDVLVPLRKIDVGTQLDPSMFRKETRAIVGGSANIVTSFEQLRAAYAASFIAAGALGLHYCEPAAQPDPG